jgi:hypothetical protein
MRFGRTILVLMAVVLVLGVVPAQEEEETGKKKKRGLRRGAATGAFAGLAMGALTGDAELALKGAAAGAAVGAASGSWYDYDQERQDDRTQMLADSIAGSKAQDVAPGETVGDVGKRHMQDFLGDWNLDIWVLAEEGKRITGTGKAKGLAAGENATRIVYLEGSAEGYEETFGGGHTLLTYDPGQGFFLENYFTFTDEVLKGVGEYLTDKNAYNYYLVGDTGGEMVSGGVLRSNVRIEIRISSPSMFVAETYTHIDGKEVQVQSYRFTKL